MGGRNRYNSCNYELHETQESKDFVSKVGFDTQRELIAYLINSLQTEMNVGVKLEENLFQLKLVKPFARRIKIAKVKKMNENKVNRK